MTVADRLKAVALKSNFKREIERFLFKKFGRKIADLDEMGCLAILLNGGGRFEEASVKLKRKDIILIEEWSKIPTVGALAESLFQIELSSHLFLFDKFHNKSKEKMVLLGCLLKNKPIYKTMSMIAQSRALMFDWQPLES